MTVNPQVNDALRTIPEGLEKGLEELDIGGQPETISIV